MVDVARWGGTSADQPMRSPGSTVRTVTTSRPGTLSRMASRPSTTVPSEFDRATFLEDDRSGRERGHLGELGELCAGHIRESGPEPSGRQRIVDRGRRGHVASNLPFISNDGRRDRSWDRPFGLKAGPIGPVRPGDQRPRIWATVDVGGDARRPPRRPTPVTLSVATIPRRSSTTPDPGLRRRRARRPRPDLLSGASQESVRWFGPTGSSGSRPSAEIPDAQIPCPHHRRRRHRRRRRDRRLLRLRPGPARRQRRGAEPAERDPERRCLDRDGRHQRVERPDGRRLDRRYGERRQRRIDRRCRGHVDGRHRQPGRLPRHASSWRTCRPSRMPSGEPTRSPARSPSRRAARRRP